MFFYDDLSGIISGIYFDILSGILSGVWLRSDSSRAEIWSSRLRIRKLRAEPEAAGEDGGGGGSNPDKIT